MSPTPTRRFLRRTTAIAATAALLLGCSSDDTEESATIAAETTTDSVSITLARSPRPAAGDTTAPVYGILVNDSLSVMRVVAASSPAADSVDLLDPDGSVLLPSDGFVIQPDGGLVMESIGFKLMLIGIDPDTIGVEIPVTLRFESGDTFGFNADVIDGDTS